MRDPNHIRLPFVVPATPGVISATSASEQHPQRDQHNNEGGGPPPQTQGTGRRPMLSGLTPALQASALLLPETATHFSELQTGPPRHRIAGAESPRRCSQVQPQAS